MSVHSTNRPVRYKSLTFLGYSNYRVGNDGSIWSCCNNRWGQGEWKLKRTTLSRLTNQPYDRIVVLLWANNKSKLFLVSRLVLLAFVGDCPDGMQCCHNNGDAIDNRLENLRWDTPRNNQRDRVKHGTDNRGTRHPLVKLTEAQIREIRRRTKAGERPCHLCKEFGVNEATIRDIRDRRSWNHI